MGQQHRLHAQCRRLTAQHHTGDGKGKGRKAPAQAVIHIQPRVDELYRQGIQQRIGVQFQDPQQQKDRRRPPETGAGDVKEQVHRKRCRKTHVQKPFQRHIRMPVRPAAQQRLGQDPRKAADRGEHTCVGAGKSPPQQQRRLVSRKHRERRPIEDLHRSIQDVDPPQ